MKHRFIGIDTETSGIDYCSSQVIQCGVVYLDESMQTVGKNEWNINYMPEDFADWNKDSEEVHKISKDTAMSHGINPEDFLKIFEQEMIKWYGFDSEIHCVAASAFFDYTMLEALWSKYKEHTPFVLSRRVMDITSLSLMVLGDAGFNTTLETLGINVDKSKQHNALYDAELHVKAFHSLATIAKQDGIALF